MMLMYSMTAHVETAYVSSLIGSSCFTARASRDSFAKLQVGRHTEA